MQPCLFIIILILKSERLMGIGIDFLFFFRPPQASYSPSTAGCRTGRSAPSVCRFGRCGNRRGIALRLGCYGRLGLRVRSCLGRCRYRCSCLCRYTPAIGGCRPRRSGCVSGRYSSRRVCLFFPYSVFARTGRRRMSRFRCCRLAF